MSIEDFTLGSTTDIIALTEGLTYSQLSFTDGLSWVFGVKCIQCYSLRSYEMDFNLDKLLNFPNATALLGLW